MSTAYLDAFSGLSGDMLMAGLLDLSGGLDRLERALASLGLEGYRLSTRRRSASGISALRFEVEVIKAQPERGLEQIVRMIEASSLSGWTKSRATAIFEALAVAEARVHRTTADQVHFHEVGAVDSIVDVVGTVWALEQLNIERLLVSPLPMGSGFVSSRHGILPVPAPATVELLTGFPVRLGEGAAEMVTPTGAAILKVMAQPAGLPLNFEIERVGYGAGSRQLGDRPSLLRILLGAERAKLESDEMVEIAANIDDLNPQIYDHVCERLLAAGARDVTITPTIMKKGRPGATLAVIAEMAERDAVGRVLFEETTTIGLRYHRVSRLKLPREIREVETRWGKIAVKVSGSGATLTVSPEYEHCRRAALAHRVALRTVMDEVREAARRQLR